MKLKVEIYDLNGKYLDKEVDLINLKTASGEITLLANHLPIISTIEISHMYYKDGNVKEDFAIAGGTLFYDGNICKIITSAIENKKEIDIERAKNAASRARNRIDGKSNEPNIDIKRAQIALLKALNRISL